MSGLVQHHSIEIKTVPTSTIPVSRKIPVIRDSILADSYSAKSAGCWNLFGTELGANVIFCVKQSKQNPSVWRNDGQNHAGCSNLFGTELGANVIFCVKQSKQNPSVWRNDGQNHVFSRLLPDDSSLRRRQHPAAIFQKFLDISKARQSNKTAGANMNIKLYNW